MKLQKITTLCALTAILATTPLLGAERFQDRKMKNLRKGNITVTCIPEEGRIREDGFYCQDGEEFIYVTPKTGVFKRIGDGLNVFSKSDYRQDMAVLERFARERREIEVTGDYKPKKDVVVARGIDFGGNVGLSLY